jgi:hypothetical protein
MSGNSLLMGKIIGSNNDSGLLYTRFMGLTQFGGGKKIVVTPVNYSTYRNEENEKVTLQEMNSKKGNPPNVYKGKRDRLVIKPDVQPPPLTLNGGKTQDKK